ncbi:sensor histidine kinase [Edaphobacter aggregans]|uniref:sensor histidine kinase n=1 Tax=Edaphobacter aggregans TaxID=570835 RepID=UPI001FE1FDB2|nr:ATP-binding protein [Edaphobacter aggregans]
MDLVERLAQHKTLGSAPREELAWLAEHGFLRRLAVGEVLSHKGQVVEGMYVILSGCLALFVDRGAGPQKLVEWREGDVTGMLPYSRLVNPPGNSIAQEPLEILELHRDHLHEMIRECVEVTSILVHRMLDRARLFTSTELQNEKMISLGKLSAGLAHELNNPASAIERSVCLLTDRLEDLENAARALEAARLTDAQLAAVDAIRTACLAKKPAKARSPLEQVDREDAICDWLAGRGLDTANAGLLAETEVTFEALNALAEVVTGPALNAVLRWAAAGCAVRSLASEIQGCSMRISSLVGAVKGFTHMDQAMVAEPLDPRPGLGSAVTVLNAKARQKSVIVAMNLEDDLPRVFGFAGELNQIWGNLLDNALDAVPEGGRVEVSARREGQRVVVRVIDDGPGIPEATRSRIFDPFFTTKPMGQGTGLGLDIAQRLVRHNDGVIEFESQPGRTEFRVSLRVADGGEAK